MGDAAIGGVVCDEHVTGPDLLAGVQLPDAFDGTIEDGHERRDPSTGGDEIASRISDGGSGVEDLVDDRAHRRPAQRREHLVACGLQSAGDDLERDRVGSLGAHVSSS